MLSIGITGGIGSGKSTACRIFQLLGVPVFNADDAARKLQDEDPEVKSKIVALFGSLAYRNNQLDRQWIAGKVFSDKNLLEQLNAIVHPATIRDYESWKLSQSGHPYILKEAAIIFESGLHKMLDKVIVVTAPENIKIRRIESRDNQTKEQILNRMKNQWNDERTTKMADYVIINDEKNAIIPQILNIHNAILKH